MPAKRRSMLEAERLRLQRLREKAEKKARRDKQYELDIKAGKIQKCPACGRYHAEKAHASVVSASISASVSSESSSTDSSTESLGESRSEESTSDQTENQNEDQTEES